ncbi:hypothetical protein OROGR_015896 [Orobanche gracilis]
MMASYPDCNISIFRDGKRVDLGRLWSTTLADIDARVDALEHIDGNQVLDLKAGIWIADTYEIGVAPAQLIFHLRHSDMVMRDRSSEPNGRRLPDIPYGDDVETFYGNGGPHNVNCAVIDLQHARDEYSVFKCAGVDEITNSKHSMTLHGCGARFTTTAQKLFISTQGRAQEML